ncbi:hypothetical protein Tco_0015928 [Tanacetum coccineum]
MWKRIQRLMQGTELIKKERQSRLMNEFDKFSAKARESLESVYNRFCTHINCMDRNKINQDKIVINTKFLNSLQSESSKYVTRARQQNTLGEVEYDVLFDFLTKNEPDQYYVTHPSLVLEHDDDYQREILAAEPEDTLSTAMMLLARAITQHFSTPTNNRLRTSSNTRNQANAGNQGRIVVNQRTAAGNDIVQTTNGNTKIMQRNLRTTTNVGKAPSVQCYSFAKDEDGIHLDDEENDFMLTSAFGDDRLEGLNALVIKMAHLQPPDNDSDSEPKLILLVSQIGMINGLLANNDHKHRKHAKLGAIRPTLVDDQLDNNIIFDDPYVEDNSKQMEHVHDVHDQKFVDFESLIRNVKTKAEKQCMANKEIKRKMRWLKIKLKSTEIGKNVKTKLDTSRVLGKLLCATPLHKIKDQKFKFVPKIDIKQDVSKPVTLDSLPKSEKTKSNTNVIAHGMYRVKTSETPTSSEKTNVMSSKSTGVVKSFSVRRPTHKSDNLKKSVLRSTKGRSTTREGRLSS